MLTKLCFNVSIQQVQNSKNIHLQLRILVLGGNNDAPAIETKLAPYGSSLEMDCRPSIDPPLTFSWSKLGGILQPDAQVFEVR